MLVHFCLAVVVFAVVAYGQFADNINTGSSTRCNNYITFLQTTRIGIEISTVYPVGACYTENTNLDQLYLNNSSYYGHGFDTQNRMYKCEETSNGTLQACQYRMGINCEGEVYKTGKCYPCNGAEDQCECVVGGDASECQFYEHTRYETDVDENDEWYCNREKAVFTRKVVNMCVQGSSGGQGSLSNYNHACGGYSWITGVSNAMYAYNDGEYGVSGANCMAKGVSVPTSAPTKSKLPTTSTTRLNSGRLHCSESTCDGVDSPRADTRTLTKYPTLGDVTYNPSKSPVTAAPVTAEPSMSPVVVADIPSSSSIATLNVLLIIFTIAFTF